MTPQPGGGCHQSPATQQGPKHCAPSRYHPCWHATPYIPSGMLSLPAGPQQPSTHGARLPSPSCSVHGELTGVLACAPCPLVDVLEVPIAGCTAQPGFAKMQPPREEEGARARLDTAAQWSADAAYHPPWPPPCLEEGELLAVDAGGAHPNDGFLQLHIIGDTSDAAADHCGGKAGMCHCVSVPILIPVPNPVLVLIPILVHSLVPIPIPQWPL